MGVMAAVVLGMGVLAAARDVGRWIGRCDAR